MNRFVQLVALMVITFLPAISKAAELRLAVTTSFNNSGLSDLLLPEVEKDLGLTVNLLVVGTGQALKLAKAGDVDAVLVHSRSAEEAFVKEGFATHRREIMYNDFVFLGPSEDPAGIAAAPTAVSALQLIAAKETLFVSRGDDSGTHRKELELWRKAGMDVERFSPAWYREVGSGMGAALNTASGMDAYIISDRASWLKFGNKRKLTLLFSGDPSLHNQYALLPVNPAAHSHVRHKESIALEKWLAGPKAQAMIGDYRVSGEVLFTPNAK